jgi:hypothetical protein
MKSSRLARPSCLLVAMLAVFAFGAITAASAAAAVVEGTKGPVWTVEGKELKTNETVEITVKAYEGTKNPIKLEATLAGVTAKVECELASVAKGAFLAGGAPGTANETAEFKDCTTTNTGSGCKVREPIVTEPIRAELAVSDEEGHFGNSILVEFDPAAGTEKLFVVLHFEGEKCLVKETEVGKGLVVGSSYTDESTPKPVTTRGTPEAASGLVKFPDEPNAKEIKEEKEIKFLSVYLLKGTVFELFRVTAFKAFSNEAKLIGTVLVLLATNGVSNGKKYGEEV